MKIVQFVSDNTPKTSPNILTMCQRDDGDIEMRISVRNDGEGGISFRMSGSRLVGNKAKIIKKFSEIIDLINSDEHYQRTIKQELT